MQFLHGKWTPPLSSFYRNLTRYLDNLSLSRYSSFSVRLQAFVRHLSQCIVCMYVCMYGIPKISVEVRGDHIRWIFGNLPNGLWPPHPIFGKQCCAFFGRPKNLQRNSFGLAWPPPLFPKIHCFYRPKISGKTATKFFGSEMTPPPFGSFPKIHWIWYR